MPKEVILVLLLFPNQKNQFDTVDGLMYFLKKCIDKYIKSEQKFYREGIKIHMEYFTDKKEARKLAGIIYSDGFIKEIGLK